MPITSIGLLDTVSRSPIHLFSNFWTQCLEVGKHYSGHYLSPIANFKYNRLRENEEDMYYFLRRQEVMSSKAIDQFNAEGDAELQEAYAHLSEKIKDKTEKRILEFYREHPDEIEDIVKMIQEEAQKQLIAASLEAYSSEPSQENAVETRKTTFTAKNKKKQLPTSNVAFSDASLKARIYSVLNAYLNLLQEIDTDKFNYARDSIEQCINDKKRIIAEWNNQIEVWGIKNKVGRWDVLYRQIRQNSITNQFNKLSRLSLERGLKVDYEGKAFYTKGNLTVGILDYPGRQHLHFIGNEDIKEDFRVQSGLKHHFLFAETGVASLSNKSKSELAKDIHI